MKYRNALKIYSGVGLMGLGVIGMFEYHQPLLFLGGVVVGLFIMLTIKE